MKIIISLITVISFGWSIGLQALNIPNDAYSLALSGSGIGGQLDIWINPSAIHLQDHRSIGITHRNWFGEISGEHLSVNWNRDKPKYWSIQSWNVNDLDLWGDIPQEEPTGKFGVRWLSSSFTTGFDMNEWQGGITLRLNYVRLFTETMKGITTDIGVVRKLSPNLNFGVVMRNIGYEYSDSLRHHLPWSLGTGIGLMDLFYSTDVMIDAVIEEEHGFLFKIGAINNGEYLSIILGTIINKDETIFSTGFSFAYRRWKLSYGISFHKNQILGIPQFIDLVYHF